MCHLLLLLSFLALPVFWLWPASLAVAGFSIARELWWADADAERLSIGDEAIAS